MIEVDNDGNINSTHVMGSSITTCEAISDRGAPDCCPTRGVGAMARPIARGGTTECARPSCKKLLSRFGS